ncbi:MAG TPA: ABC transporter permease [Ignavibacteriaceae bacterium]|nr:ABC transporter permease [Ignavibacteriaceae bacterium]
MENLKKDNPFEFSEALTNFFQTIAGLSTFSLRFFQNVFIPPFEFGEIKKHMDELGIKTMPIVTVAGFIIGLVLAMQSQPVMQRFGAESYLPSMVSLSVVRELGPVLTALLFAGRVSSGIGAELGSMRVTEQIDAMEVSAVNPYRYLVVTRILACTFILPILTLYVDFLAVMGGYMALKLSTGTTFQLYINAIFKSLEFSDLIPGILKTFVFGFIVGAVGSYKGYNADNGTVGVGQASTSAVVMSSLLILLVDMVLVKITVWIWAS